MPELPRVPLGDWFQALVNFLDDTIGPVFDLVDLVVRSAVGGLTAALLWPPSWVLVLVLAALGWWLRGWRFALFALLGFGLVVSMREFPPTMQTSALVLVASVIAIAVAVPLGVLAARSGVVSRLVRPVLDLMQTMPAFVYLIPVIFFFNIGAVPGVVATVIFALPPGVRLTELEAGPTYAGLAKGDVDLFLDSWLPQTHADYWAQYHDRLEDLGVWYDRATLNIAVPDYLVDVNSIEDLRGRAAEFGGTITGIDPGAGLSRVTRDQMIPQYGLEGQYALQTSSTTAMLASLQRAVDAHQPIVVTLWHPHWAYAKFPIKDLADPRGAMGEAEQIHAVGRRGFTADFPDVTGMVRKFHLDDQQLASLENEVNAAPKGQEKVAAAHWADAHPDVIASFAGH